MYDVNRLNFFVIKNEILSNALWKLLQTELNTLMYYVYQEFIHDLIFHNRVPLKSYGCKLAPRDANKCVQDSSILFNSELFFPVFG